MKKILIISTSLRTGSNSELAAKEVERGALEAGHEVTFLSLKGKKIAYCLGCLACQKLGHCAIQDDANAITDAICACDEVVWVSPIYYYEMPGQMKTLIDRANSLYSRKRNFTKVHYVTVAAEEEEDTPKKAISGLEGWIDCFDGMSLGNTLFLGGINDPGEIHSSGKEELAYQFGKAL